MQEGEWVQDRSYYVLSFVYRSTISSLLRYPVYHAVQLWDSVMGYYL